MAFLGAIALFSDNPKDREDGKRFLGFGALYYNYIRPNMALGGLTPAQAAGIDLGYSKNKWMEFLTLDGNNLTQRRKLRRFVGYTLRVWKQDGKELSKFSKRRFKTEFASAEKAKEFLRFYEATFPDLVFFVEKKFE